MNVVWSENAVHSFSEIIDFLELTWGTRQIQQFYILTEKVISQIQKNPYQFKSSAKSKNIRKGFVHKNVSVYYQINQQSQVIELLFFFDNRRKAK